MTKIVPTAEQVTCTKMIGTAEQLKIVAGAGCSKTTTLGLCADAEKKTSLYLAFNKAMVEEAKQKFPAWVTVKTTHGLAYGVKGVEIAHKLVRPRGRYVNVLGTGGEIAREFRIGPIRLDSGKSITAAGIGVSVKNTVNRFEYSADSAISTKHVSFQALGKLVEEPGFNYHEFAAIVIGYANLLWKRRINPDDVALATHDTYLKLYQLSKPDLSAFDVIYLDEGQDTNDCVLSIVQAQTCKVVIVGDPYQQIYGWRGSINAMEKFVCDEATLSTSFRFGQAVADVANMVLNINGDSKLRLKGWDQLESTIQPYLTEEQEKAEHARLYRTNANLIADGVELIGKGLKVAMEIDVQDFTRLLESAIALSEDRIKDVKHENLVAFDSWAALVEEARLVGGELGRIVNLVNRNEAYRVMEALGEYRKPTHPDVILTTAHKSKGREFDVVVLADDFPSCYNQEGSWVGLDDMERNLLYVAATRARKVLVTNCTIEEIYERQKLKGDKPNANGLIISSVQVMTGEDYMMNHEHTVDMVLGDMARAGVITTREEVEEAVYLAQHDAKHGTAGVHADDYDNWEDS